MKLIIILIICTSMMMLMININIDYANGLVLLQKDIERNSLLSFRNSLTQYDPIQCFERYQNQWTNLTYPCDVDNIWSRVICNNGTVVELDFAFCQMAGSISSSLGSLKNLATIDLSYNQLSGKIPSEFGLLQYLNALYLNDNSLTGTIPIEMMSLNSSSSSSSLPLFSRLDVSVNQLTGSIPTQIGLMSAMIYIDMRQNYFSGSIPIQISQSLALYFYLDNNFLTGTLPSILSSTVCKKSRIRLSLSCNLFTNDLAGCLTGMIGCTTCHSSYTQSTNNIPAGQCIIISNQSAIPTVIPTKTSKPSQSQSKLPLKCKTNIVLNAAQQVYSSLPGNCPLTVNALNPIAAGFICHPSCQVGYYPAVTKPVTVTCSSTGKWLVSGSCSKCNVNSTFTNTKSYAIKDAASIKIGQNTSATILVNTPTGFILASSSSSSSSSSVNVFVSIALTVSDLTPISVYLQPIATISTKIITLCASPNCSSSFQASLNFQNLNNSSSPAGKWTVIVDDNRFDNKVSPGSFKISNITVVTRFNNATFCSS